MFRWLFGDTPQRHYEEGMRQYNEGELEASLSAFDSALEGLGEDPSHPYTALARFYRAEAQAKLGARLLHDGRDADALRYLDAALLEQPGYPDLHFRKAVALYRLDDAKGAEVSAGLALDINGDLAEARVLLSVILREAGREVEAEAEIDRARDSGKRRPTALTRFLDSCPDHPSAQELWEHLFDEESLRRRVERAEHLYHAGLLDESEQLLDELVRGYPEFPDLQLKKALILFRRGDQGGAMVHLERALEIHPGFGDALILSAAVLLHQGQVERARCRYEEAREGAVLPSPFADYGLALCRHLIGDEEGCDELLRPLLAQGDVPEQARSLLACSRALEGQYELARAAFADLIRQGASREATLDAAIFHLEYGDFDSLEDILSSLEGSGLDPGQVLARVQLLCSHDRRNDALQLLVDYDAEHGLHPALVVEEARLRYLRGEASAALRRLDAVLERWPESSGARRERARLLSAEDRPGEALEELGRLRGLRVAKLADELTHLQILRRCGKDEQAEREAERLAQLHPLSLRVRSQQRGRWLAPLAVEAMPSPPGKTRTDREEASSRA